MSKQYGLRRRLKRIARLDGIPTHRDWTVDQLADAIAEKWNQEFAQFDTLISAAVDIGDPEAEADDECPF